MPDTDPDQATLRTGLLLELPNKDLENSFWADESTLKAYTSWDTYICVNMLISISITIKTFWPALTTPSVLYLTWHMHLNTVVSFISFVLILFATIRHPSAYRRMRHKIIVWNRLLRLCIMAFNTTRSNTELQATMARAMNVKQSLQSSPVLFTAVMNMTRPLYIGPLLTLAHGYVVFAMKYWLPLQLLTVLMAVFGSLEHQHCRLAADPSSALLLQQTCQGITDLHGYIASSILGPALIALRPFSSMQNITACSHMTSAARVLVWYTQMVYGALIPATTFGTLEWRLKAKWVQQELGKQLVYGPLGWPQSDPGPKTFASVMQSLLSWVLFTVGAFSGLWLLSTWLVPRLPLLACETCVDKGTCQALAPCDVVMCDMPGLWMAVVMFLLMATTLIGQVAHTHIV